MAQSDFLPPAVPVVSHDGPPVFREEADISAAPLPVERGRGKPLKNKDASKSQPSFSAMTSKSKTSLHSSPLTATVRKKKFVCPICELAIEDAVVKKPRQDSVQCDGTCDTWLHTRCAGLSKAAFKAVSESDDPFYCPQCRLDKQDLELKSLRVLACSLSSKLSAVCGELAELKSSASPVVPLPSQQGDSY